MSPTTKYPSAPASPAGVSYNFSPTKPVSKVTSVRDKIDFSSGSISSSQAKTRKTHVINNNFEDEFKDTDFVRSLPKLGET